MTKAEFLSRLKEIRHRYDSTGDTDTVLMMLVQLNIELADQEVEQPIQICPDCNGMSGWFREDGSGWYDCPTCKLPKIGE